MLIDADYKPWLCAELKTDIRPALTYVKVERIDDEGAGRALAANGFFYGAVPVLLEEGDVPGLVRAPLFQKAVDAYKKLNKQTRPPQPRLILGENTVTLPDDSTWPRYTNAEDKTRMTYPDLARVTPLRAALLQEHSPVVGFNVELLFKLYQALGGRVLVLSVGSGSGPMLVETQVPDAQGRPQLPYGVLMPMHVSYLASFKVAPEMPAEAGEAA